MKLGFFTACFPQWDLAKIAAYAQVNGYQALEVSAWPEDGRAFTATHLPIATFTQADADAAIELFAKHSLEMSSIAFYDNHLHVDEAKRADIRTHLFKCIDAAQMIGCPTVGTFIGRDISKSVSENLAIAEPFFREVTEYAGERDVKVIIENCVMEGWHPDLYPGNLAYSPELWEWMFELGLYLNYDPSHLLWVGIDPIAALKPVVHKVIHSQAKDLEIFADKRNQFGSFGRQVGRTDAWDTGWWRYRVPGRGDVDWNAVVDALYEGGFDGVLSIEHEDPVWGGTPEKVQTGLEIARRTLSPLIVG